LCIAAVEGLSALRDGRGSVRRTVL